LADLIPAVSSSVFAETIQGIDSVLAPQGYHLFIGTTEYDLHEEETMLRALLGRRPDGVVLVGTEHTSNAHTLLATAGVPLVETWELADEPIDSVVGFSNYEAMGTLFDYAADLGYKYPILAGRFSGDDGRALSRRKAFEDGMQRRYPDKPVRVIESP